MAKATGSSVLEGKPRKAVNKNEARRVRRGGQVPAVLYGAGKATASLSVEPREVLRILNSETGHNTIFDLTLDGEKTRAMIVDWQYEPIKGKLLHVDFKRIAMDKVLRV
jgi:large subunit ribosomal protein L25